MLRKLNQCSPITAGDGTRLRELLHPDRDYDFTGSYSLAHAVVPVGKTTLKHRLKVNEVYYILTGHGMLHIDNQSFKVEPGDAVDIPPGAVQWIENVGLNELTFLCIVSPAWRAEDEEILE
ncbi:MAG: cupin domain-containing protein [candidate division Zixibacteria bacterium]|nr:cupin domain-containing protein [candidate division Zixibacteria bacterium]